MSARPGPRGRGAMNVGVLGPVRTTRRVAATAVVVLVAAIVALVPSASVADDPPPYPTFFATFTTGGPLGDNRFAPGAGVVDLLDPTPTGGADNPTPGTVVGASEPTALQGVALLRTGIVLAPHGGALGRLLPLVRLGVGGRLGPGTQFWPWITLVDEVRSIAHLLTTDVRWPVNLVAAADRNVDVVKALAAAVHRPAVVPVPAWALRLALQDFSSEVLGSIRASTGSAGPIGARKSSATPAAAALYPRSDVNTSRW